MTPTPFAVLMFLCDVCHNRHESHVAAAACEAQGPAPEWPREDDWIESLVGSDDATEGPVFVIGIELTPAHEIKTVTAAWGTYPEAITFRLKPGEFARLPKEKWPLR